jgi:hypothetical protein
MPQMSLYFDEDLASEIQKNARKEKVSVSKYVSDALRQRMSDEWTEDFLSALGAVRDASFVRPAQPDFSFDAKRGKL